MIKMRGRSNRTCPAIFVFALISAGRRHSFVYRGSRLNARLLSLATINEIDFDLRAKRLKWRPIRASSCSK